MSIDETLKSNLIADVENILEEMYFSDEIKESLKRCFEITIGHHYAQSRDTVSDEDVQICLNVLSIIIEKSKHAKDKIEYVRHQDYANAAIAREKENEADSRLLPFKDTIESTLQRVLPKK